MAASVDERPWQVPEDIHETLTRLATSPCENPTSAERARIGEWLGIPPHLLPWRGRKGNGQR